MQPYKIVSATLISYSVRRHPIKIETEPLVCPVREAKERILDTFARMCSHRSDPFVKIEVKTRPLFN